MGDNTGIQWSDATWNPVTGCTRVSAGCDNCYAAAMTKRLAGMGSEKYLGLVNEGKGHFNGVVKTWPETLEIPLRWKKPRRVFVNSMSDLFHPGVPDGFIMDVWRIMARTPQHTYQILTKRPERMAAWLERFNDLEGEDFADFKDARGPEAVRAVHPSGRGQMFAEMIEGWGEPPEGAAYPCFDWAEGMMRWSRAPLPNVWLGTSVEGPAAAAERIPHLLQTPAAVRFLSCEPLLGRLDLRPYFAAFSNEDTGLGHDPLAASLLRSAVREGRASTVGTSIDWVIVGAESGPDARPCNVEWIRSIVCQCQAAGVPVFVKQLGANVRDRNDAGFDGNTGDAWDLSDGQWVHLNIGSDIYQGDPVRVHLSDPKGGDPEEWPEDLRVREFPETPAPTPAQQTRT